MDEMLPHEHCFCQPSHNTASTIRFCCVCGLVAPVNAWTVIKIMPSPTEVPHG